jgi:hypothetical protein
MAQEGAARAMTERDEPRDRPGDEMVRLTVAEAADRLVFPKPASANAYSEGRYPTSEATTGECLCGYPPVGHVTPSPVTSC